MENKTGYINGQREGLTIDVSALVKGVYFLELKHENGSTLIKKIVKE